MNQSTESPASIINKRRLARNFLVLNCLATLAYLLFSLLTYEEINESLVFLSTDAKGYRSVASFIYNGASSDHTIIRPLLYPAVLGFMMKGGIWGVVIGQGLMWLGTVNLVWLSARRILQQPWTWWVSAAIVGLSFSLIGLSFHALTEVPTAFLLSILLYQVTSFYKNYSSPKFIFSTLLLISCLTLVRPVFFPILVVTGLVILVVLHKRLILKPIMLGAVIAGILPVVLQIGFMKSEHDLLKVSDIGGRTFKTYFVAQVHGKVNSVDHPDSIVFVKNTSKQEDLEYLYEHSSLTARVFIRNIKESLFGIPVFTQLPKKRKTLFTHLMRGLNKLYAFIIILGAPLIVWFLLKTLKLRRWPELVLMCLLFGITYAVVLSCGLSFNQGDRLVAPLVVVWPTAFLVLLSHLGLTTLKD